MGSEKTASTSASEPRCSARTGKGVPCQRRVSVDQARCWQHTQGLGQKWRSLTRSQSVVFSLTLVGVIGTLITGLAWVYPQFWITLGQQRSDVAMRFVYPKAPALVLVNQSPVIAREIKWAVVLWNVDLPDRDEPLPIPVSTIDWLRPGASGGPQSLFDQPNVAVALKPGDRLIGTASVICAECARGRSYIVSIIWGEGGWFSELEGERGGDLLIPGKFDKGSRAAYFRALEAAAPTDARVAIEARGG